MTCQERIDDSLQGRLEDIRLLWAGYNGEPCEKCDGLGEAPYGNTGEAWKECDFCDGTGTMPEDVPDLGNLCEYGLGFGYTDDEDEPFFQWQLSWGGPGDEFRFFVRLDKRPYRIEYWFLDWFDGAHKILQGTDLQLLTDILEWFGPQIERELA